MRLSAATFLVLGLTTALTGCGAIKALEGEPDRDVFELRPPSDTPLKCGRGRIAELVIEAPKARGTLDTERIMIRPSALQTQYLPDARWGDTVPVTLQTLLVRGFGAYDVWTHVGRAPLGTAGDYAIISEINDFNAEVSGDGAIVKMTVDAQMVREADATVVSRGHFDLARRFRAVYSRYQKSRDLIQLGAYVAGSDPETDRAMICGSPHMIRDCCALLDARGFEVSPHIGAQGDYVIERAFVEK